MAVKKKELTYDEGNTPWLWNGKPLESFPEGVATFVYLITNKTSGKQYVGFKTVTSSLTKVVNHKKKKVLTESDWRNYWSSSNQLFEAVEREGKDNFLREILYMCPNKAVGKFLEAEEQFCRKVMTENADLYYNGIINLRLGEITVGQWRNAIKASKLLGDRLAKKLRAKRVNQE